MRHSAVRSILILSVLGAVACDSSDPAKEAKPKADEQAKSDDGAKAKADDATVDDAKADDAKADDPKADDPKADDAKADDAAPLKDAAVFVVRDKGIVVLDASGYQTIPGSASVSPRKLARGGDNLYALTSNAVFSLHAGKMKRAADLDYKTLGSISVFAVDGKGTIWAAGSKGVSNHTDGTWTTATLADVGLPETYFTGIAIDGEGQPWVATGKDVAHRVDGGWVPVEVGKKKSRYIGAVESGPDGGVFLTASSKLYRINPNPEVVKVKAKRFSRLSNLAFSSNGYGVLSTGLDSVSVFMPVDKATRYGHKDFNIGNISAVGIDDSGRVWIGGDGGVAIVGPNDLRVTWRSGAVEEIAGKVGHIAVMGNGPVLPEAGEVKRGGLKGKVLKAGAAVADTKIEMCEAPSMIYRRTPCTGKPTHLQGTTDAEGNFEFTDVPLGSYGVAVKAGKKWQITLGAALGSKMKEGESFDIGSVELKE